MQLVSTWGIAFLVCSVPSFLAFRLPDPAQRLDPSLASYQLFTRLNPTEGQFLTLYDVESLKASHYDNSKPTKFWCGGYGTDGSDGFYNRDLYMTHQDINYITVDARPFVDVWIDGPREQVINVTLQSGIHVAAFIDFLVENGAPISSFHLIGSSAGTHVVGAAGAAVRSGIVPRISGMDGPAFGVYLYEDLEHRLDPTDAAFVDYIHTTGPPGVPEGFSEPCGHADFYVNGGLQQPNCPVDIYDDLASGCSHARILPLWSESIYSVLGFVSTRCDTYENYLNGLCLGNDVQLMGEKVSPSARGTYYLTTNNEPPYARG